MNQSEYMQEKRNQAQTVARNKNIEAVLDDFEEMRNQICNGGVQFHFETPESFDHLTVELLKVEELKKIASILAEKE